MAEEMFNQMAENSSDPASSSGPELVSTIPDPIGPSAKAVDEDRSSDEETLNTENEDSSLEELGTDWDALREENRSLKDRLDAVELKLVTTKLRGDEFEEGSTTESSDFDLDSVLEMDDDDLTDVIYENPKDFLRKFAVAVQQSIQDKTQQDLQELERLTQINSAYDEFGEANEGFWDLWNSGKIKEVMDSNPAHNAMSAYLELTAEQRKQASREAHEKAVQQAVDKAVKETGERAARLQPKGDFDLKRHTERVFRTLRKRASLATP